MMPENGKRTGYTIVELLVAIIIIGILTSVIVPTLLNRAEEAKVSAALHDLETIKNALERAEIDTGYLYRLYVLDNNSGGDGVPATLFVDVSPYNNPNDRIEGMRDEPINQYGNPVRVFIDPENGELLTTTEAAAIWNYNFTLERETSFNWQGRYLSWRKDGNVETQFGGVEYKGDDIGDDPWGSNYLFFTREGLIREPDGLVVDTYMGADALVFDRFVILSLGRNGLPGDGTAGSGFGEGDDLMIQF